jgi:predicted solute-binding protein
MPARINKPNHDTKTKRLIAAGQLLNHLIKHANGDCEMTSTQVNAAKIVIDKSIPTLKSVEVTGEGGGPLVVALDKLDLKGCV